MPLQKLINRANTDGIPNNREKRYLVPDTPVMPVLYWVPKVNKNSSKPPGRPILSGTNSLFSRLGEYLYIYLQPLAANSPSYLKDSKDVLNSLEYVGVDEQSMLVTVDMESLYTNIQQTDAMNAVTWALNKYTNLQLK